MELSRITRQQEQRLYYPRYFRALLRMLWLTLLVNIALVPVLIFLYFSQSNPQYFANNFDGGVSPIVPIPGFVPPKTPNN